MWLPTPHLNLTMSSLEAEESLPPQKHTITKKTKSQTQDTQNKTHKKKTKQKGDHNHQLAQQHPKFHLKVYHQQNTIQYPQLNTKKKKENKKEGEELERVYQVGH